MEKIVKLHSLGSEIYTVRAVHVSKGETVRVGQHLFTLSSSNLLVDVHAEEAFEVKEVLVLTRDHVKASNALLRVRGEVRNEYLDRRAAGY